jgi:hypothetical protein
MSRRTDRACLVCDFVEKRIFDFLSHYQYELATNTVERGLHAQRGGFCALHTWQYTQIASPQGLCAGYSASLQEMGERLLAIAAEATAVDELVRELKKFPTTEPSCSVCEIAAQAEEEALGAALTRLIAVTATNDAVPFFCFTHLTALASRCTDLGAVRLLVEQHGEELKCVAEDMRQYIAKFDALRRDLISAREREAPLRGLMLLAGHTEHIP